MTRQLPDAVLERWLQTLPASHRGEVVALFDERLDDVGLTRTLPKQPGSGFTLLPIVLAGTMVEPDDEGAPGTWFQDFYEYAADQKYIFIEERHFHICTRASSAREALRRGLIPADFKCSVAHRTCPMGRMLASRPGRSVRLSLIPASSLARRSGPQCSSRQPHRQEAAQAPHGRS